MPVKSLLQAFAEAFPQGEALHKITLDNKGQLTLSLMIEGRWHFFVLEDIDFQRSPAEVVAEIKGFLIEDGHLPEVPIKPNDVSSCLTGHR